MGETLHYLVVFIIAFVLGYTIGKNKIAISTPTVSLPAQPVTVGK